MAVTNFQNIARMFPVWRSPLYGVTLRSPQSMVRWQDAASTTIEAKHVAAILNYLDLLLGVQFAEVIKVQQAIDVWATDIYFRACFNEADHIELVARSMHGGVTIHRVERRDNMIYLSEALPL